MTVQTTIPDIHKLKQGLGVDKQGALQVHVTNVILKNLIPYIPLKVGTLRGSARVADSTHIKVSTPYARAQFFGVTREGEPFDYEPTGPSVGAHWDRRMTAERGKAILADAKRYARRLRFNG